MVEIFFHCFVGIFSILPIQQFRKPVIQVFAIGLGKNLEGKDGQRQLLYYETLIRACNKVLYNLVYKGKKFVFLKEPLYLINQ